MPTQTFNASTDTWLSSQAIAQHDNHGQDGTLRLQYHTTPFPPYFTYILLRFDLTGIARGSTIQSAILSLAQSGTGADSQGELHHLLLSDWDASADYIHASHATDYEWPGLAVDPPNPRVGAANDVDPNFVLPFAMSGTLELTIDDSRLGGLVSRAVNELSSFLSLRLRAAPGLSQLRHFFSANHPTEPPPQITISWAPPTYSLTITESPDAGGTITVGSPLSHPVPIQIASGTPVYLQEGEVATITVHDAATYDFDSWTGADSGDVGGAGPYTITMDADKAIQANWIKTAFRLTLNEGVNGTDVLTPDGVAPLHTYDSDELFYLRMTPDAGFQLDALTKNSGDEPYLLAMSTGLPAGGNVWTTQGTYLTQDSQWTTSYKALWTLTTNTFGGANGVVANGSAASGFGWPQAPLFAAGFLHVISIKPNIGYQAQVDMSAGIFLKLSDTNLRSPIYGLDASDWIWWAPDANATLNVTWVAIGPGQTGGTGLFHKPFDDDKGKLIL